MTIIDRQNLEKVIAEQLEHTTGKYSDEDAVRIGNLTNASHILTGNISRTPNRRLMVEFSVTELESNERKASYSPKQVSFQDIENLSAVKAASADLLTQLGVNLTSAGLAELKRVENSAIQGQTMLARAIAAEKRGSEVEALTYFLQAAAFDPSLSEAVDRSQTLSVDISSGNIGDNTRSDIQRRKDWIARLTEMETSFSKMMDASDPPYKLFYSTSIERGQINYRTETTSFSFPVNLRADMLWFSSIQSAVQTVYNGLDATGKKKEWGLERWPLRGVSGTNPFDRERYNIAVEFELVNEEGKVIGRQTANMGTSYQFSPKAKYSENTFQTVTFNAVNANDISDIVTVRVVSVNGAAPEYSRIQITALSDEIWRMYREGRSHLIIRNGVVYGFDPYHRLQSNPQNFFYLPVLIWGDPVFFNSIAENAFYGVRIDSLTIPDNIISIGTGAFKGSRKKVTCITIGKNVRLGGAGFQDAFDREFDYFYVSNRSRAGTYTYNESSKKWSYRPNMQTTFENATSADFAENGESQPDENGTLSAETPQTNYWGLSGTFYYSFGIPFLSNIDPMHQGAGFVWSPNVEFYRTNFSFLRIGLDLELSWIAFGVDKNEVEKIHAMDLKNDNIMDAGAGVVKAGAFVSLFPVDFMYLSGGIGFGGYQKYWAKTKQEESLSPSPGWIYAPVFSVGGGIIIPGLPRSMGILIAVKYNTLPVNGRTAEYWSINLGIHLGKALEKALEPSENMESSTGGRGN
jgi:hypothetical protein